MSFTKELQQRSQNKCELCQSEDSLSVYKVLPELNSDADYQAYICQYCEMQIQDDSAIDIKHWRHLPDTMWNPVPAIQVLSYRQLHRINETWARDALDILYLENELKAWADEGVIVTADGDNSSDAYQTLDSNGTLLSAGDTVTLIKDLTVKGAGFTAKRGTSVRNISLTDNPLHVEGKVNGVRIVLVSDFLKKA